METLNASDAKREFGQMILKAQHGPVGINKNGKPVAVVISAAAFAEISEMNRKFLQLAIDQGVEDVQEGRVSGGKETISRLRKLVTDAGI